MKKILFSLLCCLMTIGASAVETTDYIKLSAATVNPGGDEVCITVSLVGSENYYTAYNMDIHLPVGMELTTDEESKYKVAISQSSTEASAIYPSTSTTSPITIPGVGTFNVTTYSYTHSLSSSYGVAGDRILRVACISQSNETFKATSGDLFTFYVKASSFTKPGAAQITIDGVALKVAGGSEYDPAAHVDENVTVSSDATASLTVSSTNKWSTCILPFDVDLPTGVEAYTCSDKEVREGKTFLKLNSASSIEAYTPYILYSENGYSGNVSGTVDATKYPASGIVTAGYLNGAIEAQSITEGYVLQNLSDGVKFYSCGGNTFTIPAGKCWVTITSDTKALSFEYDESAKIDCIADKTDNTDAIYNLSGQKVSTLQPNTIYVRSGKKFINK